LSFIIIEQILIDRFRYEKDRFTLTRVRALENELYLDCLWSG